MNKLDILQIVIGILFLIMTWVVYARRKLTKQLAMCKCIVYVGVFILTCMDLISEFTQLFDAKLGLSIAVAIAAVFEVFSNLDEAREQRKNNK